MIQICGPPYTPLVPPVLKCRHEKSKKVSTTQNLNLTNFRKYTRFTTIDKTMQFNWNNQRTQYSSNLELFLDLQKVYQSTLLWLCIFIFQIYLNKTKYKICTKDSGNSARNLPQSKETCATLGREVASFIMSAALHSPSQVALQCVAGHCYCQLSVSLSFSLSPSFDFDPLRGTSWGWKFVSPNILA